MASFNQSFPNPATAYPPGQPTQGQATPPTVQTAPPPGGSACQPPGATQPQMMSPTKEPNYAMLCRVGQECVHDIVNKTNEVFQTLRVTQLPNGTTTQSTIQVFKERKNKIDELLQNLNMQFRKLRVVYDKLIEFTDTLENPPIETLLPFKGVEVDERAKMNDVYRFVSEEHKEISEQVRLKNKQLKEVIDQVRNLIWEINTMITMRKS